VTRVRNHVAVVGSYGVGIWIRAARFPERGETLIGSGFTTGHGGKGSNQAIGIARLGVPVALLTCVGSDRFGADALDQWKSEGVDVSHVRLTPDRPTMVGVIFLDQRGDNRIVIDPGALEMMDSRDVEAFADVIARSSVVLAQTEIPISVVAAAMRLGRRAGAMTVLNPAPAQLLPRELLGNVDLLTPNESEARILLGLAPGDDIDDEELARRLLLLGPRTVVMTLGERGALIASATGIERCAGVSADVVDTTGAGDGFIAALVTALAQGEPLRRAVDWGNHAGATVVSIAGVVPALPRREALLASLNRAPAGT
jgi:ribokinase